MNTVIVADLHCNSTVGLCAPNPKISDGSTVNLSKPQKWLWQSWLEFVQWVQNFKPFVLVFNGDIIEGDFKNRTFQLMTRNRSLMVENAVKTIEPLASHADRIYFTRGTPAHSGKEAEIEDDLAREFNAVKTKDKSNSWYILPLDVDGVKMNIAHSAPVGSLLPWAKHNSINTFASRAFYEYAAENEEKPDFIIRSHGHFMKDSYDHAPIRAIFTPSWCLTGEYFHHRGFGLKISHTVGGICITNKKEVHKFTRHLRRGSWEIVR